MSELKFLFIIALGIVGSIILGFWFQSFWVGFIGCAIFGFILYCKAEKEKEELRISYTNALKSGNKKRALELGREYYASLREDGRLTIYDEQAIQNDLLSMDE